MAKLEFIPLEPQPVGHLRFTEGRGEDFQDSEGRKYPIPEGWGEAETATQTLFGQVCFVRMERQRNSERHSHN